MSDPHSYCVMCKNPESLCNCVDSVQAFAQAHVTSHDGKALIDGDTLTVLILRALEWAADRSRGPSHESPKRYDIQAFTEGYEGSEYAVLEVTEANDGDWVKWSDIEGLLK